MANPASALLGARTKRKRPTGNAASALIARKPAPLSAPLNIDMSRPDSDFPFHDISRATTTQPATVVSRPSPIASPVVAPTTQPAKPAINIAAPAQVAPTSNSGRLPPAQPGETSDEMIAFINKIRHPIGVAKPGETADDMIAMSNRIKAAGAGQPLPEEGDATLQDRWNRIYRTTPELEGDEVPKVTPEQEARFQQRKADAAERQAGRGGRIVIGGPNERTIEIAAAEVGTAEGVRKARGATRTATMGGMGMQAGTQQITLGGKKYAIPAWMKAHRVIESAEALRHQAVMEGHTKIPSYKEVLAMATDTEKQVFGVDESDKAMIRMGGRDVPISHFRTQAERARAEAEAERTGLPASVNRPSGADPRLLGRQQVPSAARGAQRRAEIKAKYAAAIKMKPTKAIKTEGKAVGNWLGKSTNRTFYTGMEKWADNWIEGTTYVAGTGATGDPKRTKFIPGKGSPIKGRKFIGGVLQRGELDVNDLTETWNALVGKYGRHGLPNGVLASVMEGLITRHDEWDKGVIMDFYHKHPKEFAAKLAGPATVANTPSLMSAATPPSRGLGSGGPAGGGTPGEITEEELRIVLKAAQSGVSTPEAEAIYERMTEEQKQVLADSLER